MEEGEEEGEELVEVTPLEYILARFAHAYPGTPLVSFSYGTRDNWIPFGLFDLLWSRLEAVTAADQVSAANAAAHGQAMVQSGKDHRVRSFTRQLHRRAFPRSYVKE